MTDIGAAVRCLFQHSDDHCGRSAELTDSGLSEPKDKEKLTVEQSQIISPKMTSRLKGNSVQQQTSDPGIQEAEAGKHHEAHVQSVLPIEVYKCGEPFQTQS